MSTVTPLEPETKATDEQKQRETAATKIQFAFRRYKVKKASHHLSVQHPEYEPALQACMRTIGLCQSRLDCWKLRKQTPTTEAPADAILAQFLSTSSAPIFTRHNRAVVRANLKKKGLEIEKKVLMDDLVQGIELHINFLEYLIKQLSVDIEAAYIQIRYWMALDSDTHHRSILSDRCFIQEMEENLRPFISITLKKMLIGKNAYIQFRAPSSTASSTASKQIHYKVSAIERNLYHHSSEHLDKIREKCLELFANRERVPSEKFLDGFYTGILKKCKELHEERDTLFEQFKALFMPIAPQVQDSETSKDFIKFIDCIKNLCNAFKKMWPIMQSFDAKLNIFSKLLSQFEAFATYDNALVFMYELQIQIKNYNSEKDQCYLPGALSLTCLREITKIDKRIAVFIAQVEDLNKLFVMGCIHQMIILFNTATASNVADANHDIIQYSISFSNRLLEINKQNLILEALAQEKDLLDFLGNPNDIEFLLSGRALSRELLQRKLWIDSDKAGKLKLPVVSSSTDEKPLPKQPKRVLTPSVPMTIALWRAQIAKLAVTKQLTKPMGLQLDENETEHKYDAEYFRTAFGQLLLEDMQKREQAIRTMKLTSTITELLSKLYGPQTKEHAFGHADLMHLIQALRTAGLDIEYQMNGSSHYKIIFHNAVFSNNSEPRDEVVGAFRPHGPQVKKMPNNKGFESHILQNLRDFFTRCGFSVGMFLEDTMCCSQRQSLGSGGRK